MKKVKLPNEIKFPFKVTGTIEVPKELNGKEVVELDTIFYSHDDVYDTVEFIFYYENKIQKFVIDIWETDYNIETCKTTYSPKLDNYITLVDYCIIPEADELLKQTNK